MVGGGCRPLKDELGFCRGWGVGGANLFDEIDLVDAMEFCVRW